MITIACVLRSGGCYDWEYVRRLIDGLRKRVGRPYRIACLTDMIGREDYTGDSSLVPLDYNWPGWWSKIELFKLPPPVLYFDLDTAIVGDITPLARYVENQCEGLMMLRGFYKKDRCSGIMGWRQDMRVFYDRFVRHYATRAKFDKTPYGYALRADRNRYRGDQEWVAMATQKEGMPVTFVQDVFPGVYSYKVDVAKRGMPDDARIICFHGKPRPHEVSLCNYAST